MRSRLADALAVGLVVVAWNLGHRFDVRLATVPILLLAGLLAGHALVRAR